MRQMLFITLILFTLSACTMTETDVVTVVPRRQLTATVTATIAMVAESSPEPTTTNTPASTATTTSTPESMALMTTPNPTPTLQVELISTTVPTVEPYVVYYCSSVTEIPQAECEALGSLHEQIYTDKLCSWYGIKE